MFFFKRKGKLQFVELPCRPLELVTREEWRAKSPKEDGNMLRLPIRYILLRLNTDTEFCNSRKQCSKTIKQLQILQMKHYKFTDIGYNFIIGGDGSVYEGRGWGVMPEKPPFALREYHGRSFSIAYVGDFQDHEPTPKMVEACKNLINHGINGDYVDVRHTIVEVKDHL